MVGFWMNVEGRANRIDSGSIMEQLYFSPLRLLGLLFMLSASTVIFAVPITIQDCLSYSAIKKMKY